ncbi:SRPBCC family protein [Spirulina sp. CS-785/01]|uniref:SRPBCC family protein n=1 Tax=Spirulina sp. CS-785/01 TaxID=3021716 RepID=UPI00232F9D6C|nr:SRPBCC family protein [Spirulina sp. CS-785/01]MDB9315126.1 SRPBCC family protein [Spirulina sp. CS-785/01]
MSDWLEHSVQVEIEAPMTLVWESWADFQKMPIWMKWIKSVQVLEDNPDLSKWTLDTGGLEFSWLARILTIVPHQIIKWESVDGLPNRGAIRFYDRHTVSVVKLSVAYAIPGVIGQIMDNLFLGRAVESTIQEDLERFREYILEQKN